MSLEGLNTQSVKIRLNPIGSPGVGLSGIYIRLQHLSQPFSQGSFRKTHFL